MEGETRSIDGLGDLEHLWSRTVLTEVRDGVVVVLEGLGLFLIKLELDEDRHKTMSDLVWDDSMVAETSMAQSRSRSLAADSEDRGLGGGRWRTDTPPSPLSSSMCNSRPTGKENRGEAQPDGWERVSKGETTGVMEEETGG